MSDPIEVKPDAEFLPKTLSKTHEQVALEWLEQLPEQLKDVPEAKHLFRYVDKEPIEVVYTGTHPSDATITAQEANRRTLIDTEDKLGMIVKMNDKGLSYTPYHKEGDKKEPIEIVREAVVRFAHHLDSFATVSMQMELLALRQISKIDREFMSEMIDELGLDKAKEIAKRVNDRRAKFSDGVPEITPDTDAPEKPLS